MVTLGVVLISCKKEGQLVTLGNAVPGALTTSVSTVVLTKPNLNVEAVKASFTPADFGYSAAATYTLQIAKTGTSFANAKEIILEVGSSSKSLTHFELNNMLLSMGFAPEVAGSVDFRIKTTIGTNVLPVYSNVKSVTITPFALIGTLYMAGEPGRSTVSSIEQRRWRATGATRLDPVVYSSMHAPGHPPPSREV